ncbi:glycosyltransferase family 4 protein [Runella sp.]|jgi:glycosyltransferase involved in cell wall biosynthesis|uniref:glycosyltransferase family 4 protein n=1 Tax=Runella sp. TaxID=1960881 RepID=UPI002626B246|nr:glycosyltransferase family 4 protein [Runella sp.]
MKAQKIIIINSHPIQYFGPLYRSLAKDFDITVLYCSDHGVKPSYDEEFGVLVQWDIPLLEGYDYKFLKNYAPKPKMSFWGLVNFGIIKEIYEAPPKSIIWIHGWQYFTNILAIFVGKLLGHTVCLRTEATFMHEQKKGKLFLRKLIFTSMFYFFDLFLYIGEQSKKFYRYYKVPDRKLISMPYSVDNERFINFYENNKSRKNDFREQMGIPLDKTVLLCVGKLVPKKRTIDLVKAFHLLNDKSIELVFVGEGEKRFEIESYVNKHKLENIKIMGFINQTQIVNYYLIADIYLMCSGSEGETWGLSTNEAMCSNLPIILSHTVGGADDLVTPYNGIVYQSGNIAELAQSIKIIKTKFCDNKEQCQSQQVVRKYSYEVIANSLSKIANHKTHN